MTPDILSLKDVEDALSIALFRLWQTRKSFDPNRSSLATWFYLLSQLVLLGAVYNKFRLGEPATKGIIASPLSESREKVRTADKIAETILRLENIKTIAFIDDRALGVTALIALACDEIVFKQGVGYDPAKLVESVRGKVGLF